MDVDQYDYLDLVPTEIRKVVNFGVRQGARTMVVVAKFNGLNLRNESTSPNPRMVALA